MNVITIMDWIGVAAATATLLFFLVGRRQQFSGINRKLLLVLLVSLLANAVVGVAESFAIFPQLDIVEDNLDLVILLCWGFFLFSLFPQFSGQAKSDRGLHTAFTRQLAGVFLVLLMLNVVYSLTSFVKSRNALAKMEDYHGSALLFLVDLRSRSNNAIQEAFAYVISGDVTEKQEFEEWARSFDQQAQRFQMLGRLDEADEAIDAATFQRVVASQKTLVQSAGQMFNDFEQTGEVSQPTFQEYEQWIDQFDTNFDRLEESERNSYEQAQANAAKILEAANVELPILGAVSIVLCASLFGLLAWTFQRYSDEQEYSRQQLAEEEKRHRTFLDNLPELIWVAGTDKQFTFFNKTWLEFTGRTFEQEQGKRWMEGVHPADVERCRMTYESAFDAREPFSMEYRLRHKHGQYRWILDFGTPWSEARDEFAGYIGGCIDITDRRRANEALRQRDQAFRTAIVPIAFADLDGRITEANQAFADLFGIEEVEQIIGKPNTGFHSEPISVAEINSLIHETGGFVGEVTSRKTDGSEIEIQINATLFNDEEGHPIGSLAAFMDVTPQREVERALRNSEQHYRTLTEVAPEAIVVLDVDLGRFVEVNESAVEMFQMSREQLLQIGPADLSPKTQPDGRESAMAAMVYVQNALDGDVPAFDWVHLDSQGNEILCEIRLTRLASDHRLVRGTLNDIRDRIELEKTLSQRALEAELLHRAVAMADETETLEDALQKSVDIVCQMIDWPVGHAYVPSSSTMGRLEPTKIWHLHDEKLFANLRRVTEQTSFVSGEGLPGRVWESGKPAWIEDVQQDNNFPRNRLCKDLGVRGCFGFPVKIRGEIIAILEFFHQREVSHDDTLLLLVRSVGEQVGRVIERREAQQATSRQHELVAEELDKVKSELILRTRLAAIGQVSAQIAHEMRNPLGAVSNAVYYLRRQVPPTDAGKWSEYLNLMDGEVATCNRFIDDLLNVTRGKEPNRMTTDLVKLIDRVVARHDIPVGIEVKVDCQPNPFEILADRDQLIQVIDNLLKNALDAIGDQPGKIGIQAHREGESAIIAIRDSGAGIKREDRGSVFDVLFTTKASGTGLGLPICKQIIERHGGTMTLVDDSSSGTAFEVRLPLSHDQPILLG